jgi:hypothetical protein
VIIRESPLQVNIDEKLDELYYKPQSEFTESDFVLFSHLTDALLHIDLEVIENGKEKLPEKREVSDAEFVIIAKDKIRRCIKLSDVDLKHYTEAQRR